MSPVLLSLGGCAYRNMVRHEHASSVALFATALVLRGDFQIGSIDYMHTSNLPQGRCLWLKRQIDEKELKLAISIDSDTQFHGTDLAIDLPQVLRKDVAMGLVPIRQGGTLATVQINLLDSRGHDFTPIVDGELVPQERKTLPEELARILEGNREIASGGFGLVVFNLDWFRAHWPEPDPEGIDMRTGEDIAMCRKARKLGGKILALRVRAEHHEFKP